MPSTRPLTMSGPARLFCNPPSVIPGAESSYAESAFAALKDSRLGVRSAAKAARANRGITTTEAAANPAARTAACLDLFIFEPPDGGPLSYG